MNKEELIILAASLVYQDWCMQEYKGFWERAVKIYNDGEKNIGNSLRKACFKGNTKRNEIFIDTGFMVMHESIADNCLNSFDDFMFLIKSGGLEIKRFTTRNLTEEEKMTNINNGNYKPETEEENILREFKYLSEDSKKENLESAISAYTIFEELSKAGVSIEQMTKNKEIRNLIGVGIHAHWLKRNPDHPNNALKVPYSELDDWTKDQDLIVFDALLKIVKDKNILIEPNQTGYFLPDYLLLEQQALEEIRTKKI